MRRCNIILILILISTVSRAYSRRAVLKVFEETRRRDALIGKGGLLRQRDWEGMKLSSTKAPLKNSLTRSMPVLLYVFENIVKFEACQLHFKGK